uniref:alkaline phosphatase n=1 Tax=Chamaesiphon sp. OTE_8_metabat_110 TaxID=2964696 RepID=UPI00286B37D6
VALDFINRYPNTLILTAADSDAGGLQVTDVADATKPVGTINNNPTTTARPIPQDGKTGAGTLPFIAAPDANGNVFPFAVAWAGTPDFSGSIVSKAHGLNSDKLPATVDNTVMYELMYETLFEKELTSRNPAPTKAPAATKDTGNVIFIHPDGTGPSHYMALRNVDKGPDGRLNWDNMSNAGVYLGHLENQLSATSNAGAVIHATGTKVFNESFGLQEDNSLVKPGSGNTGKTILEEAIEAGKATVLIQSGHLAEPGSAAFAAKTTNRDGNEIRARDKYAEIIEQVIRSGTNVIFGGGELYMLPKGTTGFHVTAAVDASESSPQRRPTTNLIDLAKSLGYTVVYTEDQMNQVVNSAKPPEKILGVFAAVNTYDDRTEEALGLNTASPKPLYVATAPTVAEMLEASLKIVKRDPDGFFAVVEEEGTDNFANNNNAAGTIEAMRRADAAIGVAQKYVDTQDPNTLVITAADSDAGGLQVYQYAPYARPAGNITTDFALKDSETQVPFIGINPTTTNTTRAFLDGANGSTASTEFPWKPFSAKDSIDGPMGNFGVSWVGTPDFPGSIVAKTYGLNADKLPSTLDNTEIYNLMYKTLFGTSSQQTLVPGTAGADDLVAGKTPGFDGVNDLVFTGAGNDKVDVPIAGSIAGNNRIDSGSGADTIFVANNDRVFGTAGDDTLDATDAKDYRISGGAGNDTLFLGANGRALGGDGNDKLFAGSGGNNLLSGGAGADQFWIANAEIPGAANTIVDFQIGTDVIGIQGAKSLGISATSLKLTQIGADTSINFGSQTLAILTGIQASSLTPGNASQFVFA